MAPAEICCAFMPTVVARTTYDELNVCSVTKLRYYRQAFVGLVYDQTYSTVLSLAIINALEATESLGKITYDAYLIPSFVGGVDGSLLYPYLLN